MNKTTKKSKITLLLVALLFFVGQQVFATNPFNSSDFGSSRDRSNISAFDKAFINPYNKTLHYAGTATAGLTMLAPAVLLFAPTNTYLSTAINYAETMILSFAIKNTIKNFVYKPRPYMYFDNYPMEKVQEGDYIRSFPSGHTTYAFAGATFATYMTSKLTDNKTLKIAVPVIAYSLATTTAILRVASGNHFVSDVLVGAIIGSTCGIAVPMINEHLPWNNVSTVSSKVSSAVTPFGFSVKVCL